MTDNIEEFKFSKHLQDSLLILGVSDKEVMNYIFLMVNPNNFQSEYARFACNILLKFYSEFNDCPANHFADIVEEEIKAKNFGASKESLYLKYLSNLLDISPNKEYVLKNECIVACFK